MPQKAHEPTEESRAKVEALASFGVAQEDIAAFIGISKPTLAKHYGEILKLAAIKANGEVGEYLFSLASGRAIKESGATHGDCRTAAIFWAKTRLGWRETHSIEHMGKDGGAIQHEDVTKRDADAFTSRLLSLAAEAGSTTGTGEADAASES